MAPTTLMGLPAATFGPRHNALADPVAVVWDKRAFYAAQNNSHAISDFARIGPLPLQEKPNYRYCSSASLRIGVVAEGFSAIVSAPLPVICI